MSQWDENATVNAYGSDRERDIVERYAHLPVRELVRQAFAVGEQDRVLSNEMMVAAFRRAQRAEEMRQFNEAVGQVFLDDIAEHVTGQPERRLGRIAGQLFKAQKLFAGSDQRWLALSLINVIADLDGVSNLTPEQKVGVIWQEALAKGATVLGGVGFGVMAESEELHEFEELMEDSTVGETMTYMARNFLLPGRMCMHAFGMDSSGEESEAFYRVLVDEAGRLTLDVVPLRADQRGTFDPLFVHLNPWRSGPRVEA